MIERLRAGSWWGAIALILLAANPAKTEIRFSGSHTLAGQYSDRRGLNQELPRESWRDDLNLTADLAGLPIGAHLALSSHQDEGRQDVNRFRLFLDVRSLARRRVREELPFLRHLRILEVGACHPHHSPLILDGAVVNGVHAAALTGRLYWAGVYGRSLKETPENPARDLIFGRFGFGGQATSHLHISYLHAWEGAAVDTASSITAQENTVLGVSGRASFFRGRWMVAGEVVGAILTRDRSSATRTADDLGIPEWVATWLDPRISSSIDYAWSASSDLKLARTAVRCGATLVGPGYQSLGAPNLRGDRRTYEGSVQQDFWGARVRVGIFARRQEDNVVAWKSATSKTTLAGFTALVRPPHAPYVNLIYTPTFQRSGAESTATENDVHVLSVTAGYDHTLAGRRAATQLSASLHDGEQSGPVLANDQIFRSVNVHQTLVWSQPLAFNWGGGWRYGEVAGSCQETWSAHMGSSYLLRPGWRATFAVDYADADRKGRTTGLRAECNLRFGRHHELMLRAQERFHSGEDEETELLLRGAFTSRW